MKKKIIIPIAIVVLAVAAIITCLFFINRKLELPSLEADDVSKIYLDTCDNNITELDIEEFLGYYNQINDLRNNKKQEGSTSTSIIIIELKDETTIQIHNSGDQFEISFYNEKGEHCMYWGKQQEIYNMLYHGSYESN